MSAANLLRRLSRLLAQEAPAQREAITRDLVATMRDGRERSLIGPADRSTAPMQTLGTESYVSLNPVRISQSRTRAGRGREWLDAHTHPRTDRFGEDATPSETDRNFWSRQYEDDGRDYQFLVSQPPSRDLRSGADYTWFKTQRPQLLGPRRWEDAAYEMQRAHSKGHFDAALRGLRDEGLEIEDDLADLLRPWTTHWLGRHDAAQGRGRYEFRDQKRTLGPYWRDEELVNEMTPAALEVLRRLKFRRGGHVQQGATR